MKNVTLDRTPILQLDAVRTDSALDAAADCPVLRNDAALDLRAIANQESRSAQFTFDSAKDLRGTLAFDVADNRHVRADAGGRSRFCRRPVMRLHHPQYGFARALILLGCAALHIQHVHLPFRRHKGWMPHRAPCQRSRVWSDAAFTTTRHRQLVHMNVK